jgi:hypothetical protein
LAESQIVTEIGYDSDTINHKAGRAATHDLTPLSIAPDFRVWLSTLGKWVRAESKKAKGHTIIRHALA